MSCSHSVSDRWSDSCFFLVLSGTMRRALFTLLALILVNTFGCRSYTMQMVWENTLKVTPYLRANSHPTPKTWDPNGLTVSWLGHATVLINFYGTTILTDPVFSERLAPPELFGTNLGIRRITQLPLRFEDLPPIDIVLLSHAHHDHWDLPSLRRFTKNTQVIIPQATRDLIPEESFGQVTELPWDQSVTIGPVSIRAVRVHHWGERWSVRGYGPPRGYNGYLLQSQGRRIFFAGDSAYRNYSRTGKSVDWSKLSSDGPIDICLLPIGASTYLYNHMSPEQAWRVFQSVQGRYFVPIHHRTFIQAPRKLEPIEQPIQRLRLAAGQQAEQIVADEVGKVFVFPPS